MSFGMSEDPAGGLMFLTVIVMDLTDWSFVNYEFDLYSSGWMLAKYEIQMIFLDQIKDAWKYSNFSNII